MTRVLTKAILIHVQSHVAMSILTCFRDVAGGYDVKYYSLHLPRAMCLVHSCSHSLNLPYHDRI